MWEPDQAPRLARRCLKDLGRRWQHVEGVGRLADQLVADVGLPEDVRAAAWLHDIGYAPDLALTGFHPLDGAVYLSECGAPEEVVGLVAWHTGAVWEASERGLSDRLARMPEPSEKWLDVVTLIDLVTGPDGVATTPDRRVAEILGRYDSSHPVHRAVKFSGPELLASAARARAALGLSDEWPLGSTERMSEAAGPSPARGGAGCDPSGHDQGGCRRDLLRGLVAAGGRGGVLARSAPAGPSTRCFV